MSTSRVELAGRARARLLTVLVGIATLAALGGGYGYFQAARADELALVEAELRSLADLHAQVVGSWHADALQDAARDADAGLADQFADWLARGEAATRARLEERLAELERGRGGDAARLLGPGTPRREVIWAAPSARPLPLDDALAAEINASTAPRLWGPVAGPAGSGARFLVSAPLAGARGHAGHLVSEFSSAAILEVLLRDGSGHWRSLETVLARRVGDDVELLSPRLAAAGTERLRVAADAELPGALGAAGGRGAFQGVDYRGRPVLAHVAPVAGAPWTLVTQVDRAEVGARLRATAARVSGASFSLLALGVLALVAVSQRREARSLARLIAAEGGFRQIFESAQDGMLITDREARIVDSNAAIRVLLGFAPEELRGRSVSELIDPAELAREPLHLSVLERRDCAVFERRYRHVLGHAVDLETSISPLPDGSVLAVLRDVSSRRAVEDRVTTLSRAFEQSSVPALVTDAAGTIEYVNTAFSRVTGWSEAEAVGANPRILQSGRTPPATYVEMWAALGALGEWHGTLLNRRRDGSLFWWRVRVTAVRNGGGKVRHYVGIGEDVSVELEREERLRQMVRLAGLGTWTYDFGSGREIWSEATCRMFGRDPARSTISAREFFGYVHPEDRERVERESLAAIEGGRNLDYGFRILLEDGRERWVHSMAEVERDQSGRPIRMLGVTQDLTERELERRQLDAVREQLAQAQKMESLGRLAGGVAHDFNNLLGVVTGYSELVDRELPVRAPQREHVREILRAVEHGTDLTRQLLALSRKSVVQPRRIDVEALCDECRRMLRRLIPGRVEIAWEVAPGLWPVLADSGQLLQVMINLALNARDAMPGGGHLTVRAANETVPAGTTAARGGFAAGDYVRIEVEDDGTGMDAETLAHIFEPFFTTRGHGAGTGLGLATVYGIVQQYGGQIRAESAPCGGTRMSLWLPRTEQEAAEAAELAAPERCAPKPGVTVLTVEDEAGVLAVVTRLLHSFGHRVVAVRSGAEALDLPAATLAGIDLVLTDLVLPGCDGRRLAAELRRRRPGLPVIYMTGHFDLPSGELESMLAEDATFLQKPFRSADLERALAERLS